ncbi:MAG: dephospho-CoA kinase [Firmicutes bacterium]|nr:dephospho-CoA kinase [Bacillota bacterium]
MKVIGLTGGIGTGKSTVSAYLRQKNIPVIDADQIARQITAPGSPVLAGIRILLGDEVFHEDGTMDRQKVAGKIFADRQLLHAYEALTTAEAVRRCLEEVEACRRDGCAELVVIDAPLLFECGMEQYTSEDWVVDADMDVRIARVKARDGLSEEAILDRIRNQMSAEEKAAKADYVLDNSGSLEDLHKQIDRLLERSGHEG